LPHQAPCARTGCLVRQGARAAAVETRLPPSSFRATTVFSSSTQAGTRRQDGDSKRRGRRGGALAGQHLLENFVALGLENGITLLVAIHRDRQDLGVPAHIRQARCHPRVARPLVASPRPSTPRPALALALALDLALPRHALAYLIAYSPYTETPLDVSWRVTRVARACGACGACGACRSGTRDTRVSFSDVASCRAGGLRQWRWLASARSAMPLRMLASSTA